MARKTQKKADRISTDFLALKVVKCVGKIKAGRSLQEIQDKLALTRCQTMRAVKRAIDEEQLAYKDGITRGRLVRYVHMSNVAVRNRNRLWKRSSK